MQCYEQQSGRVLLQWLPDLPHNACRLELESGPDVAARRGVASASALINVDLFTVSKQRCKRDNQDAL